MMNHDPMNDAVSRAKEFKDYHDLERSIAEIRDLLLKKQNGHGFDRQKAEEIIRKHDVSEPAVAIMKSPLLRGWIPFRQANDDQVASNLIEIKTILEAELARKLAEQASKGLFGR